MWYLAIAFIAYLAGSLPGAWLAGKLLHFDLRNQGSGNLGATNTLRLLGYIPALLVLLFDSMKAVLSVLIISRLHTSSAKVDMEFAQVLAGGFCMLGHIFPVWFKFKGGKGVATGATVIALVAPVSALACLGLFICTVALTRYISLGSVVAALFLPISYMLFSTGEDFSITIFSFCLFSSFLVVGMHIPNIVRLLKGEEHKFQRKER